MEMSRRAGELVTSVITAGLGAIVCYGSLENGIVWDTSGPQPGYFPFYVGCLIIFGSAVIAGQALVRPAEGQPAFLDGERARAVALFFLPIIAFVAISVWLGLYIGMAIYAFYAMYWPGKLKLTTSILVAAAVVAVNFIIFEKLFMVPLLKGPVLNYFGVY